MTRCLVLITRVYLESEVVPTTTIMTELKFQRHRLNTVVMSDHMVHHPLCLSYCTVFVLVYSYELRESGKILSSALMKWYCSEPLLESLCECICDSLWLIDQGKSHSSESGVISASSLLTEHAYIFTRTIPVYRLEILENEHFGNTLPYFQTRVL